jgi:hypothetical protein
LIRQRDILTQESDFLLSKEELLQRDRLLSIDFSTEDINLENVSGELANNQFLQVKPTSSSPVSTLLGQIGFGKNSDEFDHGGDDYYQLV